MAESGASDLQFLGGMIHEALDVLPVEQARDNREVALRLCGVGSEVGASVDILANDE